MSRLVFTQSVLLPRLLAAIGAGSLLAGPGCGGKSKDNANEQANEIGGKTTGDGTKDEKTETVGTTSKDVETRPTGNTTNGIDSPGKTTPAVSPVTTGPATTGEVTNPSTQPAPTTTEPTEEPLLTSNDEPAPTGTETTVETTSVDGGVFDAASVDASSSDPTQFQCDFGEPQEFCLNAEAMENQARWGVGDLARTEPLRNEDEIAAGWQANGCMNHEWIASGCCNPALGAGVAQKDDTCCYVACEGACCGRPFVVNGVAVVAPVVASDAWLVSEPRQLCGDLPVAEPSFGDALAQAWLEDARMEHASIASFGQFALDLLQLGAPPALVRDCHLAGLDEIEHARVGFSLASMFGGKQFGPGELAVGGIQLRSMEQTIAAAIVEGCVGETFAAAIVAEQARRCTNASIARQLAKIAEDELRHSELAWRFVAWALQRCGADARRVAEATFAHALRDAPEAPTDLGVPVMTLHGAGRITSNEWRQTTDSVLRSVIRPAVAALLEAAPIGQAAAKAVALRLS